MKCPPDRDTRQEDGLHNNRQAGASLGASLGTSFGACLQWLHRRQCARCRQVWHAEQRIERGVAQMQALAQPQTLSDPLQHKLLDALGLPQLPALGQEDIMRLRSQLKRMLCLLGLVLFVTTLAQPELIAAVQIEKVWFAGVPNALQSALLWLLLGVFLYAKPLLGCGMQGLLLAQAVAAGKGRAAQAGSACKQTGLLWTGMTGASLAGAGVWALLGGAVGQAAVTLLALGVSAILALLGTLLGGLLVEQAQRLGATGRLGALHAACIFAARLTGAGILTATAGSNAGTAAAGTGLHDVAAVCIVLLAGVGAACWKLLAGMRVADGIEPAATDADERHNAAPYAGSAHRQNAMEPQSGELRESLRAVFANRNVWGAAAIGFLVYLAPNFTALQAQQDARLGFSAAAQSAVQIAGGVFGLAGVGGYLWLCRRLSLQTLLRVGILANACGTLLYLGYRSLPLAILIEGANGLLSALLFAMLFDLAIRAIPRRQGLVGYALLTGVFALASHLSNVFGSWLNVGLGWQFARVVGVSALLALPALAIIARLPAALLDRREDRLDLAGSSQRQTIRRAGLSTPAQDGL